MKTILIIEDDEASLSSYALALENAGYRTLQAGDGGEGVALARRHLPDLILCDINLPTLNGWKMLKILRDDPGLADVQFVFMTGNVRANTSRTGMECGADDFLEKPFGVDALLACVQARFRRADLAVPRVSEKALEEFRASLRSTLPHEIFTPLSGILGLTEVMRTDLPQLDLEEMRDYLDSIYHSGHRLHRTLRNYLFALDLEDAESDPPPPPALHPEELELTMRSAAETGGQRHQREEDLNIRIEPVAGSASTLDLQIIVEEIVDNACVFSRPGTPIGVNFGSDRVLTISDRGRGMTAEQLGKLGAFRQFDRKTYEQQGLGLGLFLVRKLSARNNIEFEIESEAGEGTTVRLVLPPVG